MTAIAVTIAGSDSSGGAGIQADLKTFSALGVYGASVITALTAQNTKGVTGIHDVPPDFIAAQIDAVFSDLKVNAVKVGMLSQAPAISAVAAGLDRHKAMNVVLDPVMVATSGDRLLKPDAVEQLRRLLIPKALVLTPNLPEAAALLDTSIAADESACASGPAPARVRRRSVLIRRRQLAARRSVDLAGRCERHRASRCAALCHPQHPWHRLHAVVGDRCGIGEGYEAHRGRAAKSYVTTAIAAADRRRSVGPG